MSGEVRAHNGFIEAMRYTPDPYYQLEWDELDRRDKACRAEADRQRNAQTLKAVRRG